MDVHERVWERNVVQWRPLATYGLLGAIVATYILQLLVLNQYGSDAHTKWFVIGPDYLSRPWSIVTSTFAHGGPTHLLFNGLMLYFLGPWVERVVGRRNYVLIFLASGIVTGILQTELSALGSGSGYSLGASGALMAIFGILARLFPNEKILLMGIVPLPFWAAAVLYAGLDLIGALGPANGIGNIAHLTGLVFGLLIAPRFRPQPATNSW